MVLLMITIVPIQLDSALVLLNKITITRFMNSVDFIEFFYFL